MDRVAEKIGPGPHRDFNVFIGTVEEDAKGYGVKLTAKLKKLLQGSLAERSEEAEAIIKKIHKSSVDTNPLVGLFEATISGKRCVVEYEPDSDLRDTEQVPLIGGGRHRGVPAPGGAALCS